MFYEVGGDLYKAFIAENSPVNVPKEYERITALVLDKVGWQAEISPYEWKGAVDVMPTNNKIALALPGGLDSVYLMHRLKEDGYDVTAVHIAGLNKSSASVEAERAAKVARLAGVRFAKVNFKTPKQHFPDNPFKNQLVLSILLDRGVRRGVYKYAVGSDWCTPLSEATTGFTITDSIEVNREFWDGVQKHFPQAELIMIDSEIKKYDRLQYLYKNHRQSLELVSSCVSPLRFREHLHKSNIAKYGVPLMSGRCGSCYKCAMEYILLARAGLIPMDKEYMRHCWDTLATSKTSHRPDLFNKGLPLETRMENLLNYGS